MAKEKPEGVRIRPSNAAPVSIEMIRAYERIMIAWIKAGESNFLQGYSSNIAIFDMLHTAGFVTDQAYSDNRLQTNLFAALTDLQAGADIFASIFGQGSPFTPQMKSRVEQNTERGNNGDEDDDEVQAAISSLATQALAGALEVAAVA